MFIFFQVYNRNLSYVKCSVSPINKISSIDQELSQQISSVDNFAVKMLIFVMFKYQLVRCRLLRRRTAVTKRVRSVEASWLQDGGT